MNEQFETSLFRRQRQLTRFMAREMLLEYAENRLEDDRKRGLEEYLPKDKDVQKELEAIRVALNYCKDLARIQVGAQIASEVEQTKLGLGKWTERLAWRNWPEVARWTAEAVLVSAVVAAVVSLLPIQKLSKWLPSSSQELVLSEIENKPVEDAPPGARDTIAEALSRPAPDVSDVPAVPLPPTFGPTTAELTAAGQSKPAAQVDEQEEPAPKPEKAPRGFVYRAFMASSQIDESTTGAKELILSLGGERAGQVDLGWRKNSGTYFHFSIPESNYESLLEGLRTFSPVRIYKDPHWRVMPEGQIRLILFIEDTSFKK